MADLVITSGRGASSDSEFRWDGRRPNEDELTNRVSAFRETSAAFVEQSDIKSQAGARCRRQLTIECRNLAYVGHLLQFKKDSPGSGSKKSY